MESDSKSCTIPSASTSSLAGSEYNVSSSVVNVAAAQGGGRWGKPKSIFVDVTVAWWLDCIQKGFIEEDGTLQEEGELVREGSGCNTA